jgi:polyhydroxyalkanoate synthase subunit PhaC
VHELLDWSRRVTQAAVEAASTLAGLDAARPAPRLAPTPRSVVATDGTAALLRFAGARLAAPVSPARLEEPPAAGAAGRGRARPAATAEPTPRTPILLVPSLINRWYVLDLRPGASMVEALVAAGFDVWLLDWGVPEAEDRHRTWTDVLDRLARMRRRVLRETGAERLAVLGYCMGGTLAAIDAALHPERIAALIDLAGPIDFARGGMLHRMVDPRWFDAGAIAEAGNVAPSQMQAGFVALRPTLELGKLVGLADQVGDARAREAARALEIWAADNIPFPGAAYRTYIGELYQGNALIRGSHHVRGRRVDLGAIRAPALSIVADRDAICPADAATALLEHVGSPDVSTLRVPGGHVGAVVGSRASRETYPALIAWLRARLS